ncbi:MAG: 4-phosphoerythronate dehydrogenase [Cellvibrionaceae bacterium]|nr:4-phosphoerythronate dehydrogenase [Cellvibrionaceae bacterium]
MIKIIVDENVPAAEAYLGHMGQLSKLPGRNLRAADIAGADALVVRSVTQVGKQLLAGSQVQFVGSCTIGTDHMELDYLNAAGIANTNAPGCNANSVAEYVFAALAAINCNWAGKRLGIIGLGNVGSALYRKAAALGIDCVGYDPLIEPERYPIQTDLNTVLGADIISMHTPLTRSGPFPSWHLIGADELAQLKPGAVLLNCGRGACIDNAALLQYMAGGANLQLVLDVWEGEPAIELGLLPHVQIATPHIAGYSHDGKVAGTAMVASALAEHFKLPAPSVELAVDAKAAEIELGGDNRFSACAQAILAAYDIRSDDRRLREAAKKSEDFALAFDRLRKQYPRRLEFKHFICNTEKFLGSQKEKKLLDRDLAALGYP